MVKKCQRHLDTILLPVDPSMTWLSVSSIEIVGIGEQVSDTSHSRFPDGPGNRVMPV